MPRVGDDPNVATAYPEGGRSNLPGTWTRKIWSTLLGTLFLLFVMNTMRKDYKSEAKRYMEAKGMNEKEIDSMIPKTAWEKKRDLELATASHQEQQRHLLDEVANLTNAVIELQQLLFDQTGQKLKHQIYFPPVDGEKDPNDTPAEGKEQEMMNVQIVNDASGEAHGAEGTATTTRLREVAPGNDNQGDVVEQPRKFKSLDGDDTRHGRRQVAEHTKYALRV